MYNQIYFEVINKLEQRLQEPLPGDLAHERMASMRNGIKIKERPNGKTRESAVLISFYPTNEGLTFPLILRPVYEGVHSGQVGLPGGRVEPDDTSFINTALREAWEEVGIAPETVEVIGKLSDIYVVASNYIIHPIVAYTPNRPDFKLDPREVDQLIEVSLTSLLDESKRGVKNMVVAGNIEIAAPYFDVKGNTVWGATAMILSELLMILD